MIARARRRRPRKAAITAQTNIASVKNSAMNSKSNMVTG